MTKLPPFHTLDRKEFSTLSNKIYDIFIIQFQNDTEIQYDDGIVIARGLKIALNFILRSNIEIIVLESIFYS